MNRSWHARVLGNDLAREHYQGAVRERVLGSSDHARHASFNVRSEYLGLTPALHTSMLGRKSKKTLFDVVRKLDGASLTRFVVAMINC